jgi:hypothetical protein
MDEQTLIKLLQIQFAHECKLRKFAGKINLTYFEIDLLGVVLDTVGVPADNSLAQIGKYGYDGWVEQLDTFSRARHSHRGFGPGCSYRRPANAGPPP